MTAGGKSFKKCYCT